jgi:hypothetical protein
MAQKVTAKTVKPTEVKPTEVKPTEVKPTEVKPTEAKPVMYVATDKVTRPGTFFANVQAEAKKPVTLADLITSLQASHKLPEGAKLVPISKKDHDMVVRVRTTYAAKHGYLKAV